MLDGDFEIKHYPSSNDLKYFVSKNNKFWIGENVGFDVGSKRKRYPDIVVCDNDNNVLGYIEIKIYPTNGVKTIDEAIKRMESFKEHYPEMKAMFIMYHNPGNGSKVVNRLEYHKNKLSGWFDYRLLMNNPEKISIVLSAFLDGIKK